MESVDAGRDELSRIEGARWRAFALMSRRVTSAVDATLQREAGVSSPDFEIMDALSNADRERARAKDLAEMLSWEKSRISHQVSRMVDRGLVVRSDCDDDLRVTWVTLTPEGRLAHQRALPHYAHAVRDQYLRHMSEDQAVQVTAMALGVVEATTTGACRAEVERLEQSLDASQHQPL